MRNKKQILIWLIERDYKQVQIAADTSTSIASVSLTISGHRNNQAVLDWLRDHGCPEEYLHKQEAA